ncbi:MAG: sigma-70 family RNA polymerase sigma factor [Flavobacteriales bacterium]|nr:sigma-70 family RNA polymerase sigma factor [Flavobacteriales bacterium]
MHPGCFFPDALLFKHLNQDHSQIIRRCLKRDRKAQYEFYKENFAYLLSICLRYTNNREDAMAMLNLSFARIMLNLKKYDQSKPLNAWMRKITVNCIIDEFRKTKSYREHVLEVDYDTSNHSAQEDLEIGSNLIDLVQKKLEELNPLTKRVFNLYAIDGYKHREIAEMLKISEGTSAWHYGEAKKYLREYLRPEFNNNNKNGKASA